jgi:hypothetical protein
MSSPQAIIKEELPVVHVLAIYLLNHGSYLFLALSLSLSHTHTHTLSPPPTHPAHKTQLSRRTQVGVPTTPLCSLDELSRVSGPEFISCMQAKPCICSYMYMCGVYTPAAPLDGKRRPFLQPARDDL